MQHNQQLRELQGTHQGTRVVSRDELEQNERRRYTRTAPKQPKDIQKKDIEDGND